MSQERSTLDHVAFEIDLSAYESERIRLEHLGLSVEARIFKWTGWRSLFVSDPEGNTVPADSYAERLKGWLPTDDDYDYVRQCMVQVLEPGKMAGWIAPPDRGINNLGVDYEYVDLPD